jgi:CheY-like chemotaxis protein
MSKIEAGKMDLFIRDLDLDKFVTEIEMTGGPLASKNTNQFVVLRGDEPLGMVRVDGTKLRQSILNLVSNAAKFTNNGRIELHAKRDRSLGRDWIELSVSDNGIGISDAQQQALFTKFTQATPMINSKYGGTGLGLSLSRNLCRLMGGDISVHSEAGKGAKFTIRIPADVQVAIDSDASELHVIDATSALPQETSSAPLKDIASAIGNRPGATAGTGDRVLIVDDDRSFLDLADRLLRKEGFTAVCTDAPRSALQLARTVKPDVILLDILMPEFDGWEVLQALKNDSSTAHIPVVILSVTDERKRALELGAHTVLARPADRVDLIQTIQDAAKAGRQPSPVRSQTTDKIAARG